MVAVVRFHAGEAVRALVTGASGFLGPYVCNALRQAGWHVRAAVRSPSQPVIANERFNLETRGENVAWAQAVGGVDAVVHLAARAHRSPARQRSERDLYELVNVTNTVSLANAAAKAGIKAFVFLSSVAVNGSTTDRRLPFHEDDLPAPRTVYAETKLKAELMLADIAQAHGMRLTVVRTPLIYGRHARGSLGTLANLLRRGIPLPLAGIRNRRSFAAAINVADFIVHRLRQADESETFLVADDEQISTSDFVRLLAEALGTRARLFSVPTPAMRGALRAVGRGHLAESAFSSLEIDTSKVRETGWRPPLTLQAALADLRCAP